jgi:hypothetical protein
VSSTRLAHLQCTSFPPAPALQYDEFLASAGAGRSHASLADYQQRAALFRANQALIEAHNARPDCTFDMAVNK